MKTSSHSDLVSHSDSDSDSDSGLETDVSRVRSVNAFDLSGNFDGIHFKYIHLYDNDDNNNHYIHLWRRTHNVRDKKSTSFYEMAIAKRIRTSNHF